MRRAASEGRRRLTLRLSTHSTFASSAPSSATMAISQQFGVGSVVSTLLLTSLFL